MNALFYYFKRKNILANSAASVKYKNMEKKYFKELTGILCKDPGT